MPNETLESYLLYIFTESIVEISDEEAKQFAIDAANDGLFSIPANVNWTQQIDSARRDSRLLVLATH